MSEPTQLISATDDLFHAAFEQAAAGMALVALDGALLRANRAMAGIFKCPPDGVADRAVELLGADGLRLDGELEQHLLRGERTSYSLTRHLALETGNRVWVRCTVSLVSNSAGEPKCFLSVIEDITERRMAESRLREAQDMLERRVLERNATLSSTTERLRYLDARQRAMLSALPDLIFLNTREGEYVDYHAADPSRLAVPPEEFLGMKISDVLPPELARLLMECFDETLRTGEPASVEYPLTLGAEQRFFEARVVACDDDKMLTIVRDITARRRAEESVRASLHEKEVLLKEIHHRVKNNLQIITSLHQLQIRRTDNDEVRHILQESEARVRTMALIHENLYQTDDLELVNLSGYLDNLLRMIFRSFGETSRRVRLVQEIEPRHADLDTAIPVGLIVNELVSNALKYACGGSDSTITVRFSKRSESSWQLLVTDNGPGLPPGLDTRKVPSLGLRLVRILARQLGGDLTVVSDGGARFELDFPVKDHRMRPE